MQAIVDCPLASADPTSNTIEVVRDVGDTISVPADRGTPGTSTPRSPSPDGPRKGELKLPLEIIESIIGIVEDKQDIKACALLCSIFRHPCQSKLFGDFTVSCDYDDSAFKEGGIVYTVAHGDCHDHIMGLIRQLKIENRYGVWDIPGGGKTVDLLLGEFVKKLKAIERLEIHGTGLEWRHRELADGLVETLQVPSLRVLKLCDLKFFPMPLILWGHTVKKVELERVLFMQTVFVGFRRSPVSPSFEEFRMDNKQMGLTLLGLHFLSNGAGRSAFAGLKKLWLEYRDGEGDSPDDINTLLTACQGSLENLVLFLTHEAYGLVQFYARNIRLDRLTKLSSFSTRLFITTRNGYLDTEHPFKLLKALFSGGPPSLREVRLSFFHRFGDEADEDAPEASGWSELDLALMLLSGLQEVSIVVCCTQCTSSQIEAHRSVYDLPSARARGIIVNRRFTDDINSALELEG